MQYVRRPVREQVRESIPAVVIGVILILVGSGVLFWNEVSINYNFAKYFCFVLSIDAEIVDTCKDIFLSSGSSIKTIVQYPLYRSILQLSHGHTRNILTYLLLDFFYFSFSFYLFCVFMILPV